MRTVTDLFNTAYDRTLQGGWSHMYVAIDVHGTVLMRSKGRVVINQQVLEAPLLKISNEYFYWKAKDVLQKFSKCDRIRMVLFTSSSDDEIEEYLELFRMNDIKFYSVNSNPGVVADVPYADFSRKFHFDVLLDDKAGFDPRHDWEELDKWADTRLPHMVQYLS